MTSLIWLDLVLFAQEGAAAQPDSGLSGIMLPLMLTMMLFYFMFMMPDRKRQKELEKQLATLKKNDPVVTSGGICGVVVGISPDTKFVTVRIDDTNNTRIKVLRAHIAHVGPHEEEGSDKDRKDDKDKDRKEKEAS